MPFPDSHDRADVRGASGRGDATTAAPSNRRRAEEPIVTEQVERTAPARRNERVDFHHGPASMDDNRVALELIREAVTPRQLGRELHLRAISLLELTRVERSWEAGAASLAASRVDDGQRGERQAARTFVIG